MNAAVAGAFLFLVACAGPSKQVRPSALEGITHTMGLDQALMEAALGIGERLIQSKKEWTVAVTNFTNPAGNFTAFGEYVANSLDARLAGGNIKLVDRQYAQRISEEMVLCAREGSIETCASMGKFKGANLLVVGRYEVFETSVRLFVKAIESETAEVAYAREVSIPKGSLERELLARSGEAVSPAAEREAKKAKWRKRWLWTAVVSAVAGGAAVGVWAATRSGGSDSGGPPPVSAGGQGDTATIVISVPPPKLQR